jgi:DNA-binding NarL/FixJ family response regulator
MDMVCFSSRLDSDRFASTVKSSFALEQFLQTQWIQPKSPIRVISPSHLLREAVFNLITVESQAQEGRSAQEWILWDYGIGRDVLFEAMRDWRVEHPDSYFMVIELPDDPEVILDCIAAGIQAYVLQGTTGEALIETMRQVDRGVFQCPMVVLDKLVERLAMLGEMKLPRPSSLTNREWDVLYCIQRNQSDGEIAAALSISVGTVKYHVHNLLGKLNVQSRWQAMQLARDNAWFEEERS